MSVVGGLARRLPFVRRPNDSIAQLEAALAAEIQRSKELAEAAANVQRERVDMRQKEIEMLALVGANLAALATRQNDGFRDLRNRLAAGTGESIGSDLYLDLLEAELTGTLHEDAESGMRGVRDHDRARRAVGRDWPATSLTMIGTARMQNLRMLTQRALAEGVEGDLVETGVWRGGACIYMRAILAAAGDAERRVFVADSFRGLPPPNEAAYPADAGDRLHSYPQLAVSRQQVEANFRQYELLDERVVFLEGWFRDTLPTAPIKSIAILRLDGDMYESTMDALVSLYAKVSPGGFVIIDDYHVVRSCAQAVTDFRAREGIQAPLEEVDSVAVWWQVPTAGETSR